MALWRFLAEPARSPAGILLRLKVAISVEHEIPENTASPDNNLILDRCIMAAIHDCELLTFGENDIVTPLGGGELEPDEGDPALAVEDRDA